MPKRKRHQAGKYKPKSEIEPNFTGPKPLTIFQGENGLWGVKDGDGNIVFESEYRRIEQTEEQKQRNEVHLVSCDTVLSVMPDDWGIVAWFDLDHYSCNKK